MPTSNETRVRVEDLVKISAQVWPASGVPSRGRAGFEPRRIQAAGDFLALSCSMERRCFMGEWDA
jgi:hypothetical protein